MRTFRFAVATMILVASFPLTQSSAQPPDELQGLIVFAPNANRTVTFSRQEVVVASFEVPRGKWLRVSYDDRRPDNALPSHLLDGRAGGKSSDGRVRILDRTAQLELHGNVAVRVEIGQNMVEGAPKMAVDPSPAVSLTARDVDVLITGRDDHQ